MKAPLDWLATYVDLPASVDDLAHRLTMSGTEIEEIIVVGAGWDDVIVGEVLNLERPPGAERLQIATVDLGRERIKAVTAAPNIATGQRVPVVLVGGTVPDDGSGNHFVLQRRPLMGISGDGMVLSARELGLSDDHSGILVLAPDAPVGARLDSVLGSVVLDIAFKGAANRPDKLSMFGLAREVAAITGTTLRNPSVEPPAGKLRPIDEPSVVVAVEAPDLCPRYSALRIGGLQIAPSPPWLTRRLEAAGVRSINNVVDVTNYVMIETGQPLHPFDFGRVHDGQIVVRRSREGERLTTLDAVDRTLPSESLVIADSRRAIAIAGVMGGAESEITADTDCILLESANFAPTSIRCTARALGLRTEASTRFERGVPAELTTLALRRCLLLLTELMDGPLEVAQLVDVAVPLTEPAPVAVRLNEFQRLLGMEVPAAVAIDNLQRLGFATTIPNGDRLLVQPPYWRRDVEEAADVVEEVARMVGYDRIPETLPGQNMAPSPLPPALAWEEIARETLRALGLTETWTDTLTSAAGMAQLCAASREPGTLDAVPDIDWRTIAVNPSGVEQQGAVVAVLPMLNPLSADRNVLRLTLAPALLGVMARNLKHTREHVAFFEIARTFFPRPDALPYERRTLAIGLAGLRRPRSWHGEDQEWGFFDLKGLIAALMTAFGIGELDWCVEPAGYAALHPGRSGRLMVEGDEAGYVGEIHPLVAARFDIEEPTRPLVGELDLDVILRHADPLRVYQPVKRFPSARRDIALVFPDEVQARRVEETVWREGSGLVTRVRIVDVYHAASLGAGRKSIALSLELQSPEGTLTQDEVAIAQARIVHALENELGGRLRA